MRSMNWKLIELASLPLEPDERTIILGDLVESGETCTQALIGVLGLVIRRQIELWRNWQPWLALLGVAGLSAYFLSGLVLSLDSGLIMQTRTYLHYGVHYEMGVSATKDIIFLACATLALLIWSWTSGVVLGSLSGRSVWLTGILFYAVVVVLSPLVVTFALSHSSQAPSKYRLPLAVLLLLRFAPMSPAKLCFLITAAWGIVCGVRRPRLTTGQAFTLAAAGLGAVALMMWTSGWYEDVKEAISNGAWHAVPWTKRIIPFLFMSWPVVYLAGTSRDLGRKLGIRYGSV